MADTVINFENMKQTSPERNFDNVDITEDFNVAAQNAQGLYGAFKFFHGIRSFFKGITALGTLAKTNKIPVLQDDGSLKFTTPADITNGLATTTEVNNALADLSATKIVNKTDANDCLPSVNKTETFFVSSTGSNLPKANNYVIVANRMGTDTETRRYSQTAYRVADGSLANDIYTRIAIKGVSDANIIFSNWEKLTTESDLSNYEKVFKKTTTGQGVQIVREAFIALGLNDNKTHTIMMKVENEDTNGYVLALITYNTNQQNNIISKIITNNLIFVEAVNVVGTIALNGYPSTDNLKNNWTFWT